LLARKVETVFTLTAEERAAMGALPVQGVSLKRNVDIAREGDRPGRCCFIVEGLACWSKVGGDGTRQILAFHIPGDMPDLQSLHLDVLDSSLVTLSTCEVAFIPHEPVRRLCFEFPRIGSIFWRWSLIDSAIFREWVMNVGSRGGHARVAHVFCELFVRLKHMKLARDDSFAMPLTQTEIGEATGLSNVHINRVVQSLRASKLITLRNGTLTVHDWEGLQDFAGFDPTYLHLGRHAVAH
jgi:CRP-like cAMP-binding protein